MKMFAMILMGLVFSFEVSALQNNQIVLQSFQQPQLQESIPVGNSENVKMASWTKTNASFGMVGQVETVIQDELLTEILIYALIVIVYSLIWNKSNKPVEQLCEFEAVIDNQFEIGQRVNSKGLDFME